jgi:hypothetical protein
MARARRGWGGFLILLAGLLGAAIAWYGYNTASTGIDHSGGVLLVLATSLLMVLGALVVLIFGSGAIAGLFLFLVLLDILGTGFAGYMLESDLIMAAMGLAAIGWLVRITGGSSRVAT